MDRREFMDACAKGGAALESVIRKVVRACSPALMRDAQASLGRIEATRDLVQEALIKAWSHCAQFRGDAEVQTWLRAILRRGVVDWLRARRDEVPLHDDEGGVVVEVETALRRACASDHAPETRAAQAESQRVFAACWTRFAADHPLPASVLRWVVEDELSTDELARLLDRSPGATRQYLLQCRKKARAYLAPWYLLVLERPEVTT